MEEYTLYEIVDLIIRDIKEQAKQQLINMQTASIPILMISEEGGKQIKQQSEELLKVVGIDTTKRKAADLEEVKALLQSFK